MSKTKLHKNAIALLITLFFIIAITLSLGVALKNVKESSQAFNNESFMYQSSMILDDVLNILKTNKELNDVKTAEDFRIFLEDYSNIFFQTNGIKVALEIKSARSKINPNTLTTAQRRESFKNFLIANMINEEYGDMLFDIMSGIKEDMSYNTDIFTQKPYLFRDYVVSYDHLNEVNDSYLKKFHDNNLKNLKIDEVFFISKDKNTSIDLNYASISTWEILLGCDKSRATDLVNGEGTYKKLDDLSLNSEEKEMLLRFQTKFFEPYLDVKIDIIQNNIKASIKFEYNIKSKRGSNFAFEV